MVRARWLSSSFVVCGLALGCGEGPSLSGRSTLDQSQRADGGQIGWRNGVDEGSQGPVDLILDESALPPVQPPQDDAVAPGPTDENALDAALPIDELPPPVDEPPVDEPPPPVDEPPPPVDEPPPPVDEPPPPVDEPPPPVEPLPPVAQVVTCGADEDCDLVCSSTSCAFDCDGANKCKLECDAGSSCDVSCVGTNNCEPKCKRGSMCEIDCRDANNCDHLHCEDGAECLAHCGDANNCKFDKCKAPLQCTNGVIVCNRECP